jgi:hypothetical protein
VVRISPRSERISRSQLNSRRCQCRVHFGSDMDLIGFAANYTGLDKPMDVPGRYIGPHLCGSGGVGRFWGTDSGKDRESRTGTFCSGGVGCGNDVATDCPSVQRTTDIDASPPGRGTFKQASAPSCGASAGRPRIGGGDGWFGIQVIVGRVLVVAAHPGGSWVARWFEVGQARAQAHSRKAVWIMRSAFIGFGV